MMMMIMTMTMMMRMMMMGLRPLANGGWFVFNVAGGNLDLNSSDKRKC
jgi:hypothetical protein